MHILNIPIENLAPMRNQPRKSFDSASIEELAQSIRVHGILLPLIVSNQNDNNNELSIIAGERRWRAAKVAGLLEVPCLIKEKTNENELEIALIENIQREDLSPLEEANSIQELLQNHNYTHDELANRLGKSRSSITNSLRILSLPKKIKIDLQEKNISFGHAKILCSLDSEKLQLKVHNHIISRKLSVRQTEDLIKNFKETKSHKKLQDLISPDIRYICDQFKGHLETKVKITGDTNRGKIEISYFTLDDLERISDLILGNTIL